MYKKGEDLLKEAKRKFPIGTKYNSLGGFINCIIRNQNFIYNKTDNVRTIDDSTNGGILYSRNRNKWAEIISPLTKSTLCKESNYFNAEKEVSLKDMIKNINEI